MKNINKYLKRVNRTSELMGKETLSIKEKKELSDLAIYIAEWDNSLCQKLYLSDIDIIEFRLDQLGLNIYHLLPSFGSYDRISEVLNNSFSTKEVLILHYSFGIPLERFQKFKEGLRFLLYPRYK